MTGLYSWMRKGREASGRALERLRALRTWRRQRMPCFHLVLHCEHSRLTGVGAGSGVAGIEKKGRKEIVAPEWG